MPKEHITANDDEFDIPAGTVDLTNVLCAEPDPKIGPPEGPAAAAPLPEYTLRPLMVQYASLKADGF